MTAENRQPVIAGRTVALSAPTQVWSGSDGEIGGAAIDGVYFGDVRHIRSMHLSVDGSEIETVSQAADEATTVSFHALLRGIDGSQPDPRVLLRRERRVDGQGWQERLTVTSGLDREVAVRMRLALTGEFASMHAIKAGNPAPEPFGLSVEAGRVTLASATASCVLRAAGAEITTDEQTVVFEWDVLVQPEAHFEAVLTGELADTTLVTQAPTGAVATASDALAPALDPRVQRWVETGVSDLDALRMTLAGDDEIFFAAGAPWYFTLFGRDSLWSARLALPVAPDIAASTLRVLARLQGTVMDDETAQEPGKILHELRATSLEIPGDDVVLPPQYYGTVDATPLWICLLADAWRAGLSDAEVRALFPTLEGAVRWLLDFGDSDGDGFLDYIDRTGHGLANQGWKDSGDSIQWRDGTLAQGPIALCEVQGYAHEAALAAAELVEAFPAAAAGTSLDAAELRAWAAALRARFAERFWVTTPEGHYPAIALDRDKQPVDALTSNIGHLFGTGIITPEQEQALAELLLSDSMLSGFGIRTMSTGARGYWPLSYHGGSVWTHDTAIIAWGLTRVGLLDAAAAIATELVDVAERFDYRVPELHGGYSRSEAPTPVPYPASCRPQAWSAAAAVACAVTLAEHAPAAPAGAPNGTS